MITLTVSVIWDKMVYTIPVLAVLMFFAAVIEKGPTPRQLDEDSDGDGVDHEMCPLSLMLASVLHASSAGASGILNMFAHQGMVLEGGPDLCKAVSQVPSNQKWPSCVGQHSPLLRFTGPNGSRLQTWVSGIPHPAVIGPLTRIDALL